MNRIDYDIHSIMETGSTNTDAKKAASEGALEGLIIHAFKQTTGKGRHGRTWESPEGNLYFSILLRPNCKLADVSAYNFITALAIFDTVQSFLPKANIELKWPNDVMISGKKVSGILIETAEAVEGVIDWLVIGIGINIKAYPQEAGYPATSLEAEGAMVSIREVLDLYLKNFESWRLLLLSNGFTPIRQIWLKRVRRGQISVRLPDETVVGEFVGIDDLGKMILRTTDGVEHSIAAGDVFFQ
ncbi:MAG: biotin--[acetyl-CoA-carboxylase] ligase [Alphaproteobacteria bacterium]|nr:biotin--[acetyl-CoA-carboxylase] ligase [Alphaproteobacteria bacterium]